MPFRVWNGSTFTTAKSARVWNGSSFVSAKSAKVWNGSSWVNFLSSVNITNQSFNASGGGFDQGFAASSYTLKANGVAEGLEDNGNFQSYYPITGEWLVGGLASDFSTRATINTLNTGSQGGGYAIGIFDTWLPLTSNIAWEVVISVATQGGQSVSDDIYLDFNVEIAYTNDTTKIIDSANIILTAFAQTA